MATLGDDGAVQRADSIGSEFAGGGGVVGGGVFVW